MEQPKPNIEGDSFLKGYITQQLLYMSVFNDALFRLFVEKKTGAKVLFRILLGKPLFSEAEIKETVAKAAQSFKDMEKKMPVMFNTGVKWGQG